jgi:phosphate acyltransferase
LNGQNITIALDAMGGDFGAPVVVPAALLILKKYPNLHITLVGDEQKIKRYLRKKKAQLGQRLTIVHTSEVVGMDELPSTALRSIYIKFLFFNWSMY